MKIYITSRENYLSNDSPEKDVCIKKGVYPLENIFPAKEYKDGILLFDDQREDAFNLKKQLLDIDKDLVISFV